MNHTKLGLLLAVSLSLVAACAAQPDVSIGGIYQVSALTHNDDACAPGGDSALGSDTFAVVTSGNAFGVAYVQVTACASVDACHAVVADLADGSAFFADFSYTVDASSEDNGVFSGLGASTGYDDGSGACTDGELTSTTLSVSGSTLQVQQQITIAPDYPVENGDECSTDGAQAAAAGQSCSQFESLTAELVESL